jgi:hypothetical protein
LGVLAEHQFEWEIDWAAYAAETNAMQGAKHARTLARYEGMRDTLLQEASIGARSKAISGRTPLSQSRHAKRFTVPSVVGQSSSEPFFSTYWMQRLTLQVGDLLRLAELEMAAYKVVAAKALATWSVVSE